MGEQGFLKVSLRSSVTVQEVLDRSTCQRCPHAAFRLAQVVSAALSFFCLEEESPRKSPERTSPLLLSHVTREQTRSPNLVPRIKEVLKAPARLGSP